LLIGWLASVAGCSEHQSVAAGCSGQSAVEFFECSANGKTDQTSSPKIVAMRVAITGKPLSETAHPKIGIVVADKKTR
jgi:hypothetical protein